MNSVDTEIAERAARQEVAAKTQEFEMDTLAKRARIARDRQNRALGLTQLSQPSRQRSRTPHRPQ